MAAPKPYRMPPKDGREIPNPNRWVCDVGHIHPSRVRAVKCNVKHRKLRES